MTVERLQRQRAINIDHRNGIRANPDRKLTLIKADFKEHQ
jgi:hypothetical protein